MQNNARYSYQNAKCSVSASHNLLLIYLIKGLETSQNSHYKLKIESVTIANKQTWWSPPNTSKNVPALHTDIVWYEESMCVCTRFYGFANWCNKKNVSTLQQELYNQLGLSNARKTYNNNKKWFSFYLIFAPASKINKHFPFEKKINKNAP